MTRDPIRRSRALALVALALMLCPASLALAQPASPAPPEELVTVDFRDVPLSQVINALIYKRPVNLLTPPDLVQKVTVKLDSVPWKTALGTILANFGYGYEEIDNIIRVDRVENLNRSPITRNYEVHHLDADGVASYINPVLTAPENGRLMEVRTKPGAQPRRTLVVKDVPMVHNRVKIALDEFDVPVMEGAREVIGPAPEGTFTVKFEGTPVVEAVKALADKLRLSIVWEATPRGTVDLDVQNLPLQRVLELILSPKGLAFEYDDRLLRLGQTRTFVPRRDVRTFRLKYANALDLRTLIQNRLSSQGKADFLISNYGTITAGGSLSSAGSGAAASAATGGGAATPGGAAAPAPAPAIGGGGSSGASAPGGSATASAVVPISRTVVVTDTLAALREIEELLRLADVLPRQVSIEVQLAEVSLSGTEKLGDQLNLELNGTGAAGRTPYPFNFPPPGSSVTNNTFAYGTISFANFQYLVSALASQGRLRTLSRPTVTTLDRQEAQILVGEQFPRITESINAQTGLRTVSSEGFDDIGIRLRVTPQIFDPDQINLVVRPVVSQRGELIEQRFPVIQTREVQTQLMVRNGDTAVIGGLMQERTEKTTAGVPGLMNWSLVGYLFGRKVGTRSKSELIVFVTPRIVENRTLQETNRTASTVKTGR